MVIKRQFLVVADTWRSRTKTPQRLRQGYLAYGPKTLMRVRSLGARAFITIRQLAPAAEQKEFEYEIPLKDCEALLASSCAGGIVDKVRHKLEWDGLEWMIDTFLGPLQGLCIAEVSLYCTDQDIALPPWVGREVSGQSAFSNEQLSLARAPPHPRAPKC